MSQLHFHMLIWFGVRPTSALFVRTFLTLILLRVCVSVMIAQLHCARHCHNADVIAYRRTNLMTN